MIAYLRFHSGQAFQRHEVARVAVAVSGGGDSMACLDLMAGHAAKAGAAVHAVTVDHGLRPEAADEIALVSAYCSKRNILHAVLRWAWDGTGNLQAEARAARYRLIGDWARREKIGRVFIGHTQTDVAETFLMRLARKSGVAGLATMETDFERDGVHWSRPLWQVSRADLRTYLRHVGVAWAEDASNEDERFDRVKARKALEALAPLGIDEDALSTVAFNLFTAKAALEHYLRDTAWRYVDEVSGDLVLPCDVIEDDRQIPMETLYRLRAEALRWVGGGAYGPRSDGMIEMDIALQNGKTHTLGGCVITPEDGKRIADRRWRVTREFNAVKDLISPTRALWDGRWQLDGDHDNSLEIRALGEAITDTPWRDTGLPRASLLASPSIWREKTLIAAPLANLPNGWTAKATGRGNFTDFLLLR
ncbi:MAG: tRNA lysidine(34) synthetase TilS [Pseudomonadota bacterium]